MRWIIFCRSSLALEMAFDQRMQRLILKKSALRFKKCYYSLMHLKVYISVLKDVTLGIFADLPLFRHSFSAKSKAFSMPLSGKPGRTIIVWSLDEIT